MIRSVFLKALLVGMALLMASGAAEAQVKPFKITGGGVVDYIPITLNDPVFHWAVGTATHVGAYYGDAKVQLLGFTSPTTAEFSSAEPFVMTAANGDHLAFHYGRVDFDAKAPGVVELIPLSNGEFITVWDAEFTPVPALCTGKFAKVIGGSFRMIAVTEPFVLGATDPVAYWWSGEGTIEFKKGK